MGHETRTAAAGAMAIEIAREFRPTIVLLDIVLPVMSGYDMARRLRAEPENKNLAIIAVSGYGKEDDMKRAREAGFDDYVVKPITLDRLNQILARASRR
jgi:two-component system, chemotaxis family, CheB/CheR fusion protein